MGNSIDGAFPVPRDDGSVLPVWAVAIVASAVGVTVLWLIAIVLLVAFQVFSGRHDESGVSWSGRPVPGTLSSESLSSLPPRIPPPSRRSSLHSNASNTSSPVHFSQSAGGGASLSREESLRTRKQSNLVLENIGFQSSAILVPAEEQHEEEREYKLHVLEPEADCYSLSSKSNRSSVISDTDLLHSEATVLSKSVRQRASMKKLDNLSGSASVGGDGQTSLESGKAAKNALSGIVLSRPVTIRQLGATIREPGYIASEFRKLPNPSITNEDIPPGAERKNRYSNILPNPKTRVALPIVFGHPNSDYINANYIRGHKGVARQYIATQGPMENTIEDFWRMVWEHKSEVIVMAVNFQERGIEKSARYWPAQGSEEYGCMEVTLLQQSTNADYNVSVLQIRLVGAEEARTVRHYRLTCWPVQGLPQTTKPVLDFLKEIKMADVSGPAVVHCSAGVGRTGTLLALDIGIQSLLQGDTKIDILRVVSTLRQDRPGMVQTKDQYRFIHQALYDLAREGGPK